MSGYARRALSKIRRFRNRDDGTATVEAVLWLPIFLAVFGLMVDSAMIFSGQSHVLRVVQDANRRLSINSLQSNAEVITYINTELAAIGVTPTQVTNTYDSTSGLISTVVVVPASELQILGYFSALTNLQIPIAAQHMNEEWSA